MFKFLKSIKDRDPAAANYLEILLTYPGVHALFIYRIANFLYKLKIPILPRFLSYWAYTFTSIDIHPGATIGKHLFIDHGPGVVIGQQVIIGDNVMMFHGVTLGGRSVTPGKGRRRHPVIQDNVVLGSGCKVLGGVTIGKNAKIGANALVIKDVEPDKRIFALTAMQECCEEMIKKVNGSND